MASYTIATVVKMHPGHAWFERMEHGITRFQADTGQAAFMQGPPEADEAQQEAVIDQILANGVDALCIVPIFPQALELILAKARRHGVVVISHEAPNLRNVDYDLEAFDNAVYGAHLMDHLARAMHERGQYAMLLGSLTSQSHSMWAKAALARQQERYPDMRIMTRKIEEHDDVRLAYEKTGELLKMYPTLDGVLGVDMTATAGAGQYIADKGLQQSVRVVGTGLVSACRPYLQSGAIQTISCWDPADAGYALNRLAVMILEGQPVTDGMDLGAAGYQQITMQQKTLYGAAMIDVTKATIAAHDF